MYLRVFSNYKPSGAYIRRGDLTDVFLLCEFGELIVVGAYTWRGLFSEFYGIYSYMNTKPSCFTFVFHLTNYFWPE